MKIVVLAGGLSPERDVSLSSGRLIASALRKIGHRAALVDVYLGVKTLENGYDGLFLDAGAGGEDPCGIPEHEPDLAALKEGSGNGDALVGPNVAGLCRFADAVFLALHGAMGENGMLQAFLDTLGVRYTGTGYAGSLLAMDKDLTKTLLRARGIPTADWAVFPGGVTAHQVAGQVGLPCVIKPLAAGSSIGVSLAEDLPSLAAALEAAQKVEDRVLAEKKISGREFSVGILDGQPLPVIEIIPKAGFYDYQNKYQSGRTAEFCPAPLNADDTQRVQRLALRVHEILRLGSYSRVDFILSQAGEFVCLEANTLPGMTPASLLPQEAKAAGISYEELCGRIVEAALQK